MLTSWERIMKTRDKCSFTWRNNPEIIGRDKALEILLSCKTVTAEEAVNLGICDKVVSGGHDPLEQTLMWFESLPKHDSSVINSMKQSVTNYRNEDDFAKERSLFANLWAWVNF